MVGVGDLADEVLGVLSFEVGLEEGYVVLKFCEHESCQNILENNT